MDHPFKWLHGVPIMDLVSPLHLTVVGDLQAELGVSAAFRSHMTALQHTGVDLTYAEVVLHNVKKRPKYDDVPAVSSSHDLNYIHLNGPELLSHALPMLSYDFFRHAYNIGYWMVETSAVLGQQWQNAQNYLDEIWTASRYTQAILQAQTLLPVYQIPHPVPTHADPTITRAHLGLPENNFLFFFAFDPQSTIARKNPFAVIDAYRRAFAQTSSKPYLVLKTHGLKRFPALRAALKDMARAHELILIERYLSEAEMTALYALTDCYVSLHRSEGFGLGIAGAMALGKPVIATGYSGNMDYMTPTNSYPVSYKLVPISRAQHHYQDQNAAIMALYPPGSSEWAEPDPDHAIELMQQIAADPVAAREMGARAAADLHANYSFAAIGTLMRERLETITMFQQQQAMQTHPITVQAKLRANHRELGYLIQRWNTIRLADAYLPGRNLPVIGFILRQIVRIRNLGKIWGEFSHILNTLYETLGNIQAHAQFTVPAIPQPLETVLAQLAPTQPVIVFNCTEGESFNCRTWTIEYHSNLSTLPTATYGGVIASYGALELSLTEIALFLSDVRRVVVPQGFVLLGVTSLTVAIITAALRTAGMGDVQYIATPDSKQWLVSTIP